MSINGPKRLQSQALMFYWINQKDDTRHVQLATVHGIAVAV
jgi:hypothetical protein